MSRVGFLIPVKSHRGEARWDAIMDLIAATFRSISRQTNPDWSAYVIADEDTPLPDTPAGFQVVRLPSVSDGPVVPNPPVKGRKLSREQVRIDKGRRLHAGMKAAMGCQYFMTVDYDDFVSKRLVEHVASDPGHAGWYLDSGYIYDGGPFAYLYGSRFHMHCGTTHIVNAELLAEVEASESQDEFTKHWLGSHIFIKDFLDSRSRPLKALPFPGAVYNVGHAASISASKSILRTYFVNREVMRAPWKLAGRLSNLHLFTGPRREAYSDAGPRH